MSRQHEAWKRLFQDGVGLAGDEAEGGLLSEESLKFTLVPNPGEPLPMQERHLGAILELHRDDFIFGFQSQVGFEHVYCLATAYPACGLASGPRR